MALSDAALVALEAMDTVGTIQWMCSHCGPHPESTGRWCASGCGRDHGRMEQMIVLSPSFVQWAASIGDEVERLRVVAEAADKVWRCGRCNGGGLIAPGDCCQTCAGDGLRVEWADDGSDLRPLVEALAELDADQ